MENDPHVQHQQREQSELQAVPAHPAGRLAIGCAIGFSQRRCHASHCGFRQHGLDNRQFPRSACRCHQKDGEPALEAFCRWAQQGASASSWEKGVGYIATRHRVVGRSGHSQRSKRPTASPFQSPFASPPGQGLSSSMVNVLWGMINLVVGYVLVARVGRFDLRQTKHAIILGLGILLMALMLARAFGRFHGGNL